HAGKARVKDRVGGNHESDQAHQAQEKVGAGCGKLAQEKAIKELAVIASRKRVHRCVWTFEGNFKGREGNERQDSPEDFPSFLLDHPAKQKAQSTDAKDRRETVGSGLSKPKHGVKADEGSHRPTGILEGMGRSQEIARVVGQEADPEKGGESDDKKGKNLLS